MDFKAITKTEFLELFLNRELANELEHNFKTNPMLDNDTVIELLS